MRQFLTLLTTLTCLLVPVAAFAEGELSRVEAIELLNDKWLGLPVLTMTAVKLGNVVELEFSLTGTHKAILVGTDSSGRRNLPGRLKFNRKDVVRGKTFVQVDMEDAVSDLRLNAYH